MNVFDMSDEQLRELAKRYEIDIPRSMSRKEIEDKVQIAVNKRQMQLEEKAKAERVKEIQAALKVDPASKARPAPESLRIADSEKVYAVFTNREEEGVDVTFNWGGTHTFHLWDGYIHVLPKCLIDDFKDPSKPIGKRPQYARRPHPKVPDLQIDTIVGHRRRFGFEIMDDKPPKNKLFGVVLDRKLYEKLGVPFPQPVARAG